MIALEEKGLQYESKQIEFSSSRLVQSSDQLCPQNCVVQVSYTLKVCCSTLLGAFQDACLHFDAAVASEPRWSASVSHSKVTAEGHKTPEVLKLNPRGQVPVLKDGDTVVSESLATLQYLEEAYPEPSLVPKGASSQVSHVLPAHNFAQFSTLVATFIVTKYTAHDGHAYLLQARLDVKW